MTGVFIKCCKDTNYFTQRNFFCHLLHHHPSRTALPRDAAASFNMASILVSYPLVVRPGNGKQTNKLFLAKQY